MLLVRWNTRQGTRQEHCRSVNTLRRSCRPTSLPVLWILMRSRVGVVACAEPLEPTWTEVHDTRQWLLILTRFHHQSFVVIQPLKELSCFLQGRMISGKVAWRQCHQPRRGEQRRRRQRSSRRCSGRGGAPQSGCGRRCASLLGSVQQVGVSRGHHIVVDVQRRCRGTAFRAAWGFLCTLGGTARPRL